MMKKFFFNFLLILLATLPSGCNKQETSTEEPEPLEGCHEYTGQLYIKVGSQSETVTDGAIEVCFDDGSFSLSGSDEMDIVLSFDEGYTGKGTYTFSSLDAQGIFVEASGTNKDYDTYDWEPGLVGSITIVENTIDKISGNYEFKGTDGDNTKTVSGNFNMVK